MFTMIMYLSNRLCPAQFHIFVIQLSWRSSLAYRLVHVRPKT